LFRNDDPARPWLFVINATCEHAHIEMMEMPMAKMKAPTVIRWRSCKRILAVTDTFRSVMLTGVRIALAIGHRAWLRKRAAEWARRSVYRTWLANHQLILFECELY
jgi:hypothetical protein